MRRLVTAEQLREYRGRKEIRLPQDTILTPSARDVARELGIQIRWMDTAAGSSASPTDSSIPRSSPALASTAPLSPSAPFSATGSSSEVDAQLVVVSAFGLDQHGILATLCTAISEQGGNIQDVSQTIRNGYFSLILFVRLDQNAPSFRLFKDSVGRAATEIGLEVSVQKQSIFDAMHRI